jgi:hypothetical protein
MNETLETSTVVAGVGTPRCEWVNRFRASGADDQINDIFGNTIGFIQQYWPLITIVFIIAFILTLVFARDRQSRAAKALITVCVAGFLLPPLITFGISLSPGPC